MSDGQRADQHFDEDPQLRALLGLADPARTLAPANPDELAGLLRHVQDDTVRNDLDARPDVRQSTRSRRRGPVTWLVAAAAAAVVAGGGYAAVSSMQDSGTVQQAGPSVAPETPEVLSLELPSVVPAKCAVPSPATSGFIAASDVAFAGTVTAVDGDTVTITPTESFVGASVDSVEVVGLRPDLRALGGQPEFVVGGTYLVSATDGQVSACGFSGAATPQLQQLYDLAFR